MVTDTEADEAFIQCCQDNFICKKYLNYTNNIIIPTHNNAVHLLSEVKLSWAYCKCAS